MFGVPQRLLTEMEFLRISTYFIALGPIWKQYFMHLLNNVCYELFSHQIIVKIIVLFIYTFTRPWGGLLKYPEGQGEITWMIW